MTFKNNKIKFVSALLIISIIIPTVLFSIPKQAQAQVPVAEAGPWGWIINILTGTTSASTTANTGIHIKDFAVAILQQAVTTSERQLLKEMTQSTVNWINSGFHGSPLFVQNPDSLFNDITKTEIKTLVNDFGYDPTKYPFGQSFALNIINGYKQTLANNAQYTLSTVINDPTLLNNYRNNFNVGGWNGFLINTQYPQNNYLGFQMMADQQLAQKLQGTVQNTTQKVQTALSQGMGFLSPTACPASINPKYNSLNNEFSPPTFVSKVTFKLPASCLDANGNEVIAGASQQCQDDTAAANAAFHAAQAAEQTSWNAANTCINSQTGKSGLVATTPGSVVASQITTALGLPAQQTVLGSMVTNSLSAVFDSLLNHFLDKGLNALASTVNPAPAPVDTFNYFGNTLTGPPTNTSVAGVLTISQNVSATAGSTSSVTISGGIAPYIIGTQPNSTIATAQISGSALTIKGIGPGATSVGVTDSSIPSQSATAQIAITGTEASLINFDNTTTKNISIDSSTTTSLTLSGGTGSYIVKNQPDASVAIALLSSDTTLQIIGIGSGQSSFVIQDSSGKSVTVNITVNTPASPDLSASPQNVSINTDATATVTLFGGTAPYSVQTPPDISVAQTGLSSTILTVAGIGPGATSAVIQDSSFPVKTTTVNITVTSPITTAGAGTTGGLGDCKYPASGNVISSTVSNSTQAQCNQGGGAWTAYTTTTNGSGGAPNGSSSGSSTPTATSSSSGNQILYSNTTPFTFSANLGSNPSSTQTLVVQNGGPSSSTIQWTAKKTQAWLSLSPSGPMNLGGGGQANLSTVSVSSATLGRGMYQDTITITAFDTSTNAPTNTVTVPVTLNIN